MFKVYMQLIGGVGFEFTLGVEGLRFGNSKMLNRELLYLFFTDQFSQFLHETDNLELKTFWNLYSLHSDVF